MMWWLTCTAPFVCWGMITRHKEVGGRLGSGFYATSLLLDVSAKALSIQTVMKHGTVTLADKV